LHNLLLQPAVVDRLSDAQLEALRSAIPLLAAPVIEGVVEAVARPVAEVMAHSGSGGNAVEALEEAAPPAGGVED
jgi:hypothetical protein